MSFVLSIHCWLHYRNPVPKFEIEIFVLQSSRLLLLPWRSKALSKFEEVHNSIHHGLKSVWSISLILLEALTITQYMLQQFALFYNVVTIAIDFKGYTSDKCIWSIITLITLYIVLKINIVLAANVSQEVVSINVSWSIKFVALLVTDLTPLHFQWPNP